MKISALLNLGLIYLFAGIPSAEAKLYSAQNFVFEYTEGWEVASNDADFDPEHRLTLNSMGDSTIYVQIMDTNNAKRGDDDLLFSVLEVLDGPLINVSGRRSHDRIGQLEGAGKHLTGKVMNMFPGGAIIFVHRKHHRALLLTFIYYQGEYAKASECLERIGKTFRFKDT